jgi:nucleoside-diphosphate-sugar epimerase
MMNLGVDPGPINLGNPEEMTVREIAELVLSLTGSKSPIEYRDLPSDDPTRRRPDITKARRILHWEPRVSVAEGLALTVEYYRERLSSLASASLYAVASPPASTLRPSSNAR